MLCAIKSDVIGILKIKSMLRTPIIKLEIMKSKHITQKILCCQSKGANNGKEKFIVGNASNGAGIWNDGCWVR